MPKDFGSPNKGPPYKSEYVTSTGMPTQTENKNWLCLEAQPFIFTETIYRTECKRIQGNPEMQNEKVTHKRSNLSVCVQNEMQYEI